MQQTTPATLDEKRWNEIAKLPLSVGVGSVKSGLCAVARIVYAATGQVEYMSDCVPPTIREYMARLNDGMPPGELLDRLGSREIAHRVLAAQSTIKSEKKRALLCADYALRVFAVAALSKSDEKNIAAKLAALPEITDAKSAMAAVVVAKDTPYYNAAYQAAKSEEGLCIRREFAAESAAFAAIKSEAFGQAFELLDALLDA